MVKIHHEGLGAYAEVPQVAVPGWEQVGWTVVPTDAEPKPAKQPKKQAQRGTAAESE